MRLHYEKIICFCCFLIYFLNVGFPSTAFNIFQPYLVEVEGVGDTGGSLIVGVRAGVSFVAMSFVALYYEKLDCRKGVFIASALTTLGFFLFSCSYTLSGFIIAASIAGIGYGLGGVVAVTLLINRWYKSNVGSVLGLSTLGSGVASVVFSPIVAQIVKASSLENAFLTEALVALIITIVLGILIRNNPHDIGADAVISHKEEAKKQSNADAQQLSKAAVHMLTFAMFCVGCAAIGSASYFSILLTAEGVDHIHASFFVSLFGASLTAGKFIFGVLFDKLGKTKTSIIMFCLMIVGVVLCCLTVFIQNPAIIVITALCTGSGASMGSIGLSVWTIELSPQTHFEKSVRTLQSAYALGGFVFMFIPGPLKELCGTYALSYGIILLMVLIAGSIIIGLHLRYQRN